MACVAYIDPGNFATNIAGGSKFGYTLVWVIVASNLMAMLIQTLSAKLGIATGRNLPEVCRERFSRRTSLGLWVQAEAIAMATDLAEFLGAAIGFHLLFGIGLFPAALITGATTFVILGLQRFGFRLFEAVITAFVGVILACYVVELWYAHPPVSTVGVSRRRAAVPGERVAVARRRHPRRDGDAARDLPPLGVDAEPDRPAERARSAAPLPLHENRRRDRDVDRRGGQPGDAGRRRGRLLQLGLLNIDSLENAHRTLTPLLGGASSALFALALIASGLSSSTVGTLAGQVVMQGFIQRQIPVFIRRAVTMLPAFIVIALGLDPSRTLVISQVVLSFGIPFALIPLVMFTARRDVMGGLVNHRITTAIAIVVATLISALNIFLLAQTFGLF